MKRVILSLLFIFIMFSLTGCGTGTQAEDETNNPIAGKIYMNTAPYDSTFDFNFVKFYNDNTFHGIVAKSFTQLPNGEKKANHEHFYGSYEISENAITLNISNDSYAGVILNDGASLKFGTDEFIDWTDSISDEDPLLLQFD